MPRKIREKGRKSQIGARSESSPKGTTRKPKIGRALLLCLLSAFLLIFSFPSFNFGFLAWFGFVPVFFSLRNKTLGQSFLLFFITGIIFWWGIIYWLVNVTFAGTVVLILYLALYFGLFGLIIRPVTRRSTPFGLFFIPSVWVLLEFVRSHLFTGFPWALLGYTQYLNLPVIQISDIAGAWSISFLIIFVNAALVEIIWSLSEKFWRRLQITAVLVFLVSSFSFGYGFFCLLNTQYSTHNTIKLSLVQGNIPQRLKWDPGAKDYISDKYSRLTRVAAKEMPDLIIWPEASLPAIIEDDPGYFNRAKELARSLKTPLLLGAVNRVEDRYYNSAMLISGRGDLIQRYDKLHLVPFGEYIPLRKTLSFLEQVVPIGDFTRGKDYTIFKLDSANRSTGQPVNQKINFAVLICFEDLFPELSRNFVDKGADLLINITNDAWFGRTSSPFQHLQASVFRAVENRVNVVRCANTGISGFIGPEGKIISMIKVKKGEARFVDGTQGVELKITKQPTIYRRFGDFFILLCFLIVVIQFLKLKTQKSGN